MSSIFIFLLILLQTPVFEDTVKLAQSSGRTIEHGYNGTDSVRMLAHQIKMADELGIQSYPDSGLILLTDIQEKIKGNIELEAQYMLIKGRLLSKNEDRDEALALLYELMDLSERENLTTLYGAIYLEIANVIAENDDLENSKKHYLMALGEAKGTGDLETLTEAYFQLCRIYNGAITVNLDSSVHYGLEGARYLLEAGSEYGYVKMIQVVTAPIMRQGNYREGLQMIEDTQEAFDKYYFPVMDHYYRILNAGYAYEALDVYDSAMMKMNEGEELRPEGLDHHRLKYLILKSMGKYQESLEAFEVYNTKRVARIRSSHANRLSSLQARLEANRTEQELNELSQKTALQDLQLRQQRILLFAMIVVFAVLIAAVLLIYRQRKLKQEQHLINLELEESKKRLEIENQYRESELKALRSQMNPHFISNALLAVQNFVLKNEPNQAASYLSKFSKLMREILENSREKSITVEEEIEMLTNFLEMHQLRMSMGFDFSINISDEIEPEVDTIPPMFLQPFVENSIEHGLPYAKDRGKIDIDFLKEGDFILIRLTDNGRGISEASQKDDHLSLSTQIIRERIDLFNKGLSDKILLRMYNVMSDSGEVRGAGVELKVPFAYT